MLHFTQISQMLFHLFLTPPAHCVQLSYDVNITTHIISREYASGLILWSVLSVAWFSSVSRLVYIVLSCIVGLTFNATACWPGPDHELILYEGESLLWGIHTRLMKSQTIWFLTTRVLSIRICAAFSGSRLARSSSEGCSPSWHVQAPWRRKHSESTDAVGSSCVQ
jgi:hypothetical protein